MEKNHVKKVTVTIIMKSLKSFLIIFFTILFASLILGLIAEVYIRYKKLAPEVYSVQKGRFRLSNNPRIGYEFISDFYAEEANKLVEFKGQGNHQGFRDRDHPVQKPEGAYRIIVLGNSLTQGWRIKDNPEIFTSVLEKELIQNHPSVEVFNFGVSGYNTQQEVETLIDKGLLYSPDLVVLSYCLNDTFKSSGRILNRLLDKRSHIQESKDIPLSSHINPFLMKSALYRLFYYRLIDPLEKSSDDYKSLEKNTVEHYFGILADLAKTHKFKVVVVIFPSFKDLKNYPDRDKLHFVKELAKANNFLCLDLLPFFQACEEEGRVSFDKFHPNVLGHRCAGQAIAAYINNALKKW